MTINTDTFRATVCPSCRSLFDGSCKEQTCEHDGTTLEKAKYNYNDLDKRKDELLASYDRDTQEKIVRRLYQGCGGFDAIVRYGDYIEALDNDLCQKLLDSWVESKVKMAYGAFNPKYPGWNYPNRDNVRYTLGERYPKTRQTIADTLGL